MNVALTRARSSLFILGHAPTLERSDDTWKGIVNNAKTRAHLFDVSEPAAQSILDPNRVQADVEFFARPSMLAKVPPPIKKLKRKASSEAVPTELMKPGELKALIARKPSVQNGALTDDMKEVNKPPMPAEFTASAPASPSIAPMDIEQPNSNNESSTTAKGQMTVPPPKAKPPPPRKRPKPETSLFVPKKPMKVCFPPRAFVAEY